MAVNGLTSGAGWYEFIKDPEATTHIIYIGENGDHYIPEYGVIIEDFMDAVVRGYAYKLVRVVDIEQFREQHEREAALAAEAIIKKREYVGVDL